MNTDAECRATLNAAAAALRDAGVQARLELRSIGLCDDGVQCAARLVDLGSLEIVEIVAEWDSDVGVMRERFTRALSKV
jgi:hypothetical protein